MAKRLRRLCLEVKFICRDVVPGGRLVLFVELRVLSAGAVAYL